MRRLAALPPAPAIARHESPALAFAALPAFERLPDAGFCPRPAWQGSDAGFARGLFDQGLFTLFSWHPQGSQRQRLPRKQILAGCPTRLRLASTAFAGQRAP
ncbi:MAG: hypothetical protein FWG56_04020, partial [Desulfovibrionaceae bacterium]|nr:hypothetical protein [Desulfovibrionaceae bacterium]